MPLAKAGFILLKILIMKELKINYKEYCLNPTQLDGILSEFYGKKLSLSGHEDADSIEYGFEDTEFDSETLCKQATIALIPFKRNK
jgi:hypothetical protein